MRTFIYLATLISFQITAAPHPKECTKIIDLLCLALRCTPENLITRTERIQAIEDRLENRLLDLQEQQKNLEQAREVFANECLQEKNKLLEECQNIRKSALQECEQLYAESKTNQELQSHDLQSRVHHLQDKIEHLQIAEKNILTSLQLGTSPDVVTAVTLDGGAEIFRKIDFEQHSELLETPLFLTLFQQNPRHLTQKPVPLLGWNAITLSLVARALRSPNMNIDFKSFSNDTRTLIQQYLADYHLVCHKGRLCRLSDQNPETGIDEHIESDTAVMDLFKPIQKKVQNQLLVSSRTVSLLPYGTSQRFLLHKL